MYTYYILVGGFNPSEKYESMERIIPYMKWKIKAMFETTNQNIIHEYHDIVNTINISIPLFTM